MSTNVSGLVQKLKQGSYRASRVKRVYLDKPTGGQRPLGLPTLADKLVQQNVAQILGNIYEADFLPNSYGYRPRRIAHGAIHSLRLNLQYKGYGHIVEADIKSYFDTVDHNWFMKTLQQRIDDKRLMSLIQQWLKAEVVEPVGQVVKPTQGTPQGRVISPVLANIYMHHVLDLWFEKVVKPRCKGRAMLIRYCDDFVVAFQLREEAEAFYRVLPQRLTVILPELKCKLVGTASYFGLRDNSRSLNRIYRHVVRSLFKWLNRRSERHSYNWSGLKALLAHYAIKPLRVWKRTHVIVDWY